MTEKIFNIGFSKTGTTSIEKALHILGYNVCRGHYNNNHTNYLLALYVNKDFNEILRMTQLWDAFCDGPWGGTDMYKFLYKHYPEAKYIHSIRDVDEWYQSFYNMFTKFNGSAENAFESFFRHHRYGSVYFFKYIFEIDDLAGNEENIKKYYLSLNKEIEYFFSDKEDQYLKLQLSDGNNWNKICNFLEKKIPNIEFPHRNRSVRYINNDVRDNIFIKIKNKIVKIIYT